MYILIDNTAKTVYLLGPSGGEGKITFTTNVNNAVDGYLLSNMSPYWNLEKI
jgi:hypothetical protein